MVDLRITYVQKFKCEPDLEKFGCQTRGEPYFSSVNVSGVGSESGVRRDEAFHSTKSGECSLSGQYSGMCPSADTRPSDRKNFQYDNTGLYFFKSALPDANADK